MNKIQKHIDVTEYRGYQLRKSNETGRVTIYSRGHGGIWEYFKVRATMAQAKDCVNGAIDQKAAEQVDIEQFVDNDLN